MTDSISAYDIAGALVRCEVHGSMGWLDDMVLRDTIIDGRYDLERAALLLSRLIRMRDGERSE